MLVLEVTKSVTYKLEVLEKMYSLRSRKREMKERYKEKQRWDREVVLTDFQFHPFIKLVEFSALGFLRWT